MPKFLPPAKRSYKQVCAKHLFTPPQKSASHLYLTSMSPFFCAFSSSLSCAVAKALLHSCISSYLPALPPGHEGVPLPQCRNEKQLPSQGFIAMDLQPDSWHFTVSPLTGKHLINAKNFGVMTLFLLSDPTCSTQLPQNSCLLCSVSNFI